MTRATALKALTAAVLLALAACGGKEEPVHLGYVEADWTYAAAPAGGRIVEQSVTEGDIVHAGDFLFRLDSTAEEAALTEATARLNQANAQAADLSTGARPPEMKRLEARLAEARAQLEKTRSERDRILPLVEQGYAPKSQRNSVETAYQAAAAAVEAAQQDIRVAALPGREASREAAGAAAQSAEAAQAAAAYRLTERRTFAPVDGTVEEVFFRPGEFVTPGTPVISILPAGGLKARFYVPEADLPALKVGSDVTVSADGLSSPIQVPVTFISHDPEFAPPVIYSRHSREKLVFMVEARIPPGAGLRPGLPVEVNW